MPQEKWIERLVRYQCLEPLIAGRRVLEVGCGTGRAADHLAQVADQVDAIDTSSLVLTQARRHYLRGNLEYHIAEPDRLGFPSHAFDVVVIPELQRWIARGGLIPELRRVMAPDGAAIFAVPSADAGYEHGLSYHDFVEYLSQGFNHVRMLGEVPFVGTIMADFEPDEELEPELDCSLIDEDDPPQGYLAVCSDSPVEPISYTVVQVPGGAEPAGIEALTFELDRLRQQLRQAEVRADEWAGKVETISSQLVSRGEELELANVRVQQFESELALNRSAGLDPDVDLVAEHRALKLERDGLQQRVAELEQLTEELRAQQGSADVDDLRRQLAEAERRVLEANTRARAELTKTRRELRDQSDEATRVNEELSAVRVALDEARALLAQRGETTGAVLSASDDEDAPLRDELEATKRELQQTVEASRTRVAELEIEVARAKRGGDVSGASGSESEPLRRLVESLTRQLETERERADELRTKAGDAAQEAARERGIRLAAEQRLTDEQAALEQQRQRGRKAEERADGLIERVEKSAEQLSSLHERIAELQALRQSERWRSDELLGRLRECQASRGSADSSDEAEAEFRPEPTQPEIEEIERELQRVEQARAEAERRAVAAERRLTNAGPSARGGDEQRDGQGNDVAELLRADLGRAAARIALLEQRCDRLLAEAQTSAETARQARRALKRVETATDVPVDGKAVEQDESSELGQEVTEKVASEQPSDLEAKVEANVEANVETKPAMIAAAKRMRALEAELDRARRVATELQATESELRDAQRAIQELNRAQQQLREKLREADGVSRAAPVDESEELRRRAALLEEAERERRTLSQQLAEARRSVQDAERNATLGKQGEGWQGDELLRVRERQIDALLEGATQHRGEVERLSARIEELNELAEELRNEREEVEARLARADQKITSEQSRAEGYRSELVDQGRQLALVEGELMRTRGGAAQD
jgi:chromosome segregation ATPase